MIYTAEFEKAIIYHNTKGETPEAIKAKTGCDTILNGMLFNGYTAENIKLGVAGTFCCKCRIDGKQLADENGIFYGYGWNGNNLPTIAHSDNQAEYDNYITSILVAEAYNRGRTAISFYNGKYTVLCVADGKEAMTIAQVEAKMRQYNSQFLILDGGGSSYLDCPMGRVDATYSRKTANRMYICIWNKKTQDKPREDKKMKVCLDPGHGTKEMNQSPDGSYIEHEFALDMASRIKAHLVRCGVDVKLTREDSSTPTLSQRAYIANAFGADLFVSLHSNAVGSKGWNETAKGLTVWTYGAGGERDRAANLLLAEMKASGIQTFGNELYHAKFTVLAKSNMPAYLVEYAFHTAHSDVELLLDNAHRDKLALATAKAICVWGGVKWIDVPTAPTKPADGTIYRVQVGAFTVEEKAVKLKAELEAKGYKPFIVKERRT